MAGSRVSSVVASDQRALLWFSEQTYVAVPFTNDLERLRQGSRTLRAWGSTSMYDSAMRALYYLNGLAGKKALILVSDGVEESSGLELDQLLAYAGRINASIYTIGLGVLDARRSSASRAKAGLLELASHTGGAYFQLRSTKRLSEVYERIETDLRSQYLLAYESTFGGRGEDPSYREIRVTVDHAGATIKARPGYMP